MFHKLKELKRKEEEEIKRKTAEMEKTHEIYSPKIDEVCREFAEAVGLEYEGMEKKIRADGEFYGVTFGISWYHRGGAPIFTVTLYRDRVFIEGQEDYINSFNLADFAQEKLVEIFEKWYKKHYKSYSDYFRPS